MFIKKKQDKTIKFYQDCNNNMPENMDIVKFMLAEFNSDLAKYEATYVNYMKHLFYLNILTFRLKRVSFSAPYFLNVTF